MTKAIAARGAADADPDTPWGLLTTTWDGTIVAANTGGPAVRSFDTFNEPLTELITLGRTLKKRTVDVLAYFDRPGSSNGPTEAINERLEHLRGSALGFRNLTNYIARSLLESGGFRPLLHPQMR